MKTSHKMAAAVAAAAVLWILSGLFGGGDSPDMVAASGNPEQQLSDVRIRQSTAREHNKSLILFGRTEGERSVTLKAETAGKIIAIDLEKGASVAAGEIIARIALEERTSRLAEAEALVDQYAIAYKAAQELSEKQFRSRLKLAESKAQLETAKAGLESIRQDIAHTLIRAPFDGVLDRLPLEVGDYAAIGDEIAGIVDLDPILIAAEVTEVSALRLKKGTRAWSRPFDGDMLEGTVSYISKVASKTTRTFRVEVKFENPGAALSEGMTAELHLDMGSYSAHLVSPAVLTLSGEGVLGVKVVDAENIVVFYKVEIIDDTPDGVWLAGLPQQINLITIGQEFVRDGQRVRGQRQDDTAETPS